MELSQIRDKLAELLKIDDMSKASEKLMLMLMLGEERDAFFDGFLQFTGDLKSDNLQPIFQYYFADRKEKMQDYTPQSLAKALCRIVGVEDAASCYDMCAGSGALTIQAWSINKNLHFICEEYDERVIPFLIANLSMRNINGIVIHGDVLSGERFKAWKLEASDKHSKITETEYPMEIKTDICISNPPYNMKWSHPQIGMLDERFQFYGMPPESNANYAFVLTGMMSSDRAAFILPNGVLTTSNKDEKNVMVNLASSGNIKAVITNPDGMFESTAIPTCLMMVSGKHETTLCEMIDSRKTFETEQRDQNGQFGGASYEGRTYHKEVKIYTDDMIQNFVDCIKEKKSIPEFSKPVSMDEIKKEENLVPARFVELVEKEQIHRDYSEIAKDLNEIVEEKNCLKLTINENVARSLGLDKRIYQIQENDEGFRTLVEKLSGCRIEKDNYITFTKNKNEMTFSNNSKEFLSDILIMIFNQWKLRIHYLNDKENLYLAEMRDALLPDLMSGKIDLTE